MKKLLTLISAMGLGLSTSSAVMNIQSCGIGNSDKSFTESSYQEYFEVEKLNGGTSESKGIMATSSQSTSDGDSTSWQISLANETQKIKMKKAGAIEITYTSAATTSNAGTFYSKLSGEDIQGKGPVSVGAGDEIEFSFDKINSGNLKINYYDSTNDSSPSFVYLVQISNNCYKYFLSDGYNYADYNSKDPKDKTEIISSFTPIDTESGQFTYSATDGSQFTKGKSAAELVLLNSAVTAKITSIEGLSENDEIRISNQLSSIYSTTGSDTISITSSTTDYDNITIPALTTGSTSLFVGLKTTEEQLKDSNGGVIKATIEFTNHDDKGDHTYDFTIVFSY